MITDLTTRIWNLGPTCGCQHPVEQFGVVSESGCCGQRRGRCARATSRRCVQTGCAHAQRELPYASILLFGRTAELMLESVGKMTPVSKKFRLRAGIVLERADQFLDMLSV